MSSAVERPAAGAPVGGSPPVPSSGIPPAMVCWRWDAAAMAALLLLAALFFAPSVIGGQVLLPTDNLFLLPPWREAVRQLLPGFVTPHNRLISDLILQNYGWKRYLAASLQHHELPLWNPYLQGGTPFLASGQYQVLYPFGLLFVLLPVARAYGYFAALHLFIAGSGAYWLTRRLGYRRLAACLAGVTFMFSLRIVTSAVWPQMISAMAWLGWVLLWEEQLAQIGERPRPWRRGIGIAAVGAVTVAMQVLSGHLEISFYVLFTALLYGLLRVAWASPGARPAPGANGSPGGSATPSGRASRWRTAVAQLTLLALMGGGGIGLSAVQLLPFSEAISHNFREGSVTYQEVASWAMPARQFTAFVMPDIFGNPSQHHYIDLFQMRRRLIGPDAHGNPTDPPATVSWGTKDYVEGASYVGILPLLLAGLALLFRWRTRPVALFGLIGGISLLLATGSPLYKPLFLFVPGFSQIHSAFRWVYIYGMAVAVLAAVGLEVVVDVSHDGAARLGRSASRTVVGWAALLLGVASVGAIAVAFALRGPLAARLQQSINHNAVLARNFTNGREFFSLLFAQGFRFAVLLLVSGLLIWAGMVWQRRRNAAAAARGSALLGVAAVVLVAADLFVAGASFNSSTPARLLRFTPLLVQRLAAAPGPARIISFGNDSILEADTAMIWQLQDARGYDTIVLRRYANFMNLIEPQTMLLPYSRVKGLDNPAALQNKLLDLLDVRYVLTVQTIRSPGYRLWYEDPGGVRVYVNEHALARAFVVHRAQLVGSEAAALAALQSPSFDPATTVVVEGRSAVALRAIVDEEGSGRTAAPHAGSAAVTGAGPAVRAPSTTATMSTAGSDAAVVTRYEPQHVAIDATLRRPGYLVLSDVDFPGWVATVDGRPTPVLRADEAFRAVALGAGTHTVIFRYRPQSLRNGALVSGLTLLILLLLLAAAGWPSARVRLFDITDGGDGKTARRVAKNSLALMLASLCNRCMDFGLIIWATTVIGAAGIGRYYFAVAVIGFLGTVGDFGLVTLLMRDVAQDRSRTDRYYANLVVIRWVVACALLLIVWAITGPFAGPLRLTADTVAALWLLAVAFFPGAVAATGSAVLKAYERMEYPAFVDVAANVLRIVGSVALLQAGLGIVGLAIAALVVNLVNASAYTAIIRKTIHWRSLRLDRGFCRWVLGEATPLMLNQLLNIFFFRIDILLLKPMTSDLAVGYYGIAYKFIDGLGFISSYLTQAMFPHLARSARESAAATKQATLHGLRVLLLLALPLATGTVVLARPIVTLFYGLGMLPAVPALQILVLYLPFSFLNGLIQYVLIAFGRQRKVTAGYIIACVFNVAANLVAIRAYSYLGAAGVTVASELVLLVPFTLLLRRDLGPLPWDIIFFRPAAAALLMAGAVALCHGVLALALPVGVLTYAVALVVTGTVSASDRTWLVGALARRLGRARGATVTR